MGRASDPYKLGGIMRFVKAVKDLALMPFLLIALFLIRVGHTLLNFTVYKNLELEDPEEDFDYESFI